MKREYVFTLVLTDEEYANLREIGEIFNSGKPYTVRLKVDPDDLIPEPLQAGLVEFLKRGLKGLYLLRLSERRIN